MKKFEEMLLQEVDEYTKRYIEYQGEFGFRSEEVVERIHPKELPSGAYGFRFYDRIELQVGEDLVTSDKKDITPFTYVGQVVFNVDTVRKSFQKAGEFPSPAAETEYYEALILYDNAVLQGLTMLKLDNGKFRIIPGDAVVTQFVQKKSL